MISISWFIVYDIDFNSQDSWSSILEFIDQKIIVLTNTTQTLIIDDNYTLEGVSVKVVQEGIIIFNIDYSPFPVENSTFNQ